MVEHINVRQRFRLLRRAAALLQNAWVRIPLIGVCVLAAFVLATFLVPGFWLTADQAGQLLMRAGQFPDAAASFSDPMRQGVALYRAGEFKRAARAFAQDDSPEATYNLGNCLLMQGRYADAVEKFDAALRARPKWENARVNRDLAAARADLLEMEGGDMGDQKLGADEIRFDRKDSTGGQDTTISAQQQMDSASMQEMWLRRVQTQPADFLKTKFAWQQFRAEQTSATPADSPSP